MKERDIQKLILLMLSKEFHPRGLFWTRDVGQFVPISEIARAIKDIATGKPWRAVLQKLRRMMIGIKGEPDIQGLIDGLWIGVEVKTEIGKQSPDQKRFQAAIIRAGGIYIVARSPEEAVSEIRAALASRNAA